MSTDSEKAFDKILNSFMFSTDYCNKISLNLNNRNLFLRVHEAEKFKTKVPAN